MFANYDHFLAVAESSQWVEAEIDLREDARAWLTVPETLRRAIEGLILGFCVGEASVAIHLGAFAAVADSAQCRVFEAQIRDEMRHASFFDRVRTEVLGGVPAETSPALDKLFRERLPSVARRLRDDPQGLTEAVGLYHMVLEGAVFTAGQIALRRVLARAGSLTGVTRGMELVLRDERWHVGFGTRCLLDAGADRDALRRIRIESEDALAAWGELLPPDVKVDLKPLLRRRLAVIETDAARQVARSLPLSPLHQQ